MKIHTVMPVASVTAIECDRCKTMHDDIIEIQEFLSWSDTCGYGSKTFGDGTHIGIDLCQYCVREVLGEWIQVSDIELWD